MSAAVCKTSTYILYLDANMGKEPQVGVEVFQILNDLIRPKVSQSLIR